MTKILISKKVMSRARARMTEEKRPEVPVDQPLPVVRFWYPSGGKGPPSVRFVRVSEMTNTHIKGFQIEDGLDTKPGKPHTYLVNKVEGVGVLLLLMDKSTK